MENTQALTGTLFIVISLLLAILASQQFTIIQLYKMVDRAIELLRQSEQILLREAEELQSIETIPDKDHPLNKGEWRN